MRMTKARVGNSISQFTVPAVTLSPVCVTDTFRSDKKVFVHDAIAVHSASCHLVPCVRDQSNENDKNCLWAVNNLLVPCVRD